MFVAVAILSIRAFDVDATTGDDDCSGVAPSADSANMCDVICVMMIGRMQIDQLQSSAAATALFAATMAAGGR